MDDLIRRIREAYALTADHFGIEPDEVRRRHIRAARKAGVHDVPERQMRGHTDRIRGPVEGPLPSVPDGYEVTTIRTGPRGQSLTARPASDPEVHDPVVPDGFEVREETVTVEPDGARGRRWVKTRRKTTARAELLGRLMDGIGDLPVFDPVARPEPGIEDLFAVYPIGDPHLGLRSKYGGGTDLQRGADLLMAGISDLVRRGPRTAGALILNLGDFFHSDDPANKTRRGGFPLDVDGDWFEILQVGRDVAVHWIREALKHHEWVHVKNLIGNHDDLSAQFLSLLLDAMFRDDPRVEVDVSGDPFQWFEWGANLIGCTHGQACKPKKLPAKMANAQREAWGRTIHRYWYLGHVHHTRKVEDGGVVMEWFRTLAPSDLHAEAHGYLSGRDLTRITLDRKHGECGRETVSAAALLAA